MVESKNMQMLKNLFRIQKMAFSLDKQNVGMDMIKNFESTAHKIDDELSNVYNERIPFLTSKCKTLETEEKRLEEITKLIEARITTRESLTKEFEETTGLHLTFEEGIKESESIDYLRSRYDAVHSYLDAKSSINKIKSELKELEKEQLNAKEEYENNINNNKLFESELKLKFKESTETVEILSDISRSNLEIKVKDAKTDLKEAEDGLEAFKLAFSAIKKNGLSKEQSSRYEADYNEFKTAYFNAKKNLIFLKLYAVVYDDISYSYEDMLFKRDKICSLLLTIIKLKDEYHINEINYLDAFENLTHKQYEDIKKQYDNVKIIKKLEEKIAFKTQRLEDYEASLERKDIKRILIEYGIIEDDTTEGSVLIKELPEEKQNNNIKPTTIINIFPAYKTMDLSSIKTRTNTVMNRVSSLLGISLTKLEEKKGVIPEFKVPEPVIKPTIEEQPTEVNVTREKQPKEQNTSDIFFEMPTIPNQNVNNNFENEFFEMPNYPF